MDNTSKDQNYWLKKNWYYHAYRQSVYSFLIAKDKRVLQLGCRNGQLLKAVQPCYGVGLESDPVARAQAQQDYPAGNFLPLDFSLLFSIDPFDYVILSRTLMQVHDIQAILQQLKKFTHARTRIIIDFYSAAWHTILKVGTWLGLRQPVALDNWMSMADMHHFLDLAGFEVITSSKELLLPYKIPVLTSLCNNILAHIPLINNLCLIQLIVARPERKDEHPLPSSSIIVTCKNERGTIAQTVERCPALGSWTELIFVEGGSSDGTRQEIERVIAATSRTDITIRLVGQTGKGKGDAVRAGFAAAHGEVLMILDGDLTVPPEELPKFFDALVCSKGEFINGSRLIYGMENKAMQFLNFIANSLLGIGFSWLLGQRFKDTLCGTKVLYKKDYEIIAAHRSFLHDLDPFGDFDLIFGAAKQSLKIIEIPVRYKSRVYGATQINRFKHGWMLVSMSWVAFKRFKWRSVSKRSLLCAP